MATFKQLTLVKNILENVGNPKYSLGQAARDAGYSPNVANNPQILTRSKNIRELLDQDPRTSELGLATRLGDLVDSAKLDHYVFPTDMSDDEIKDLVESVPGCRLRKIKHSDSQTWAYFWSPDNKSRKDALDMAMKIRGSYAAQKVEVTDPYRKYSNEELDQKIAELEGLKITERGGDNES